MKKASRFMPEYKPEKGGNLALFVFGVILIALAFYAPEVIAAIAGILAISFIWCYFEQPKIDSHFDKLRNERRDLSICNFAREFDVRMVDTWVIRATYEQVQKSVDAKHVIPIKATDHLFETLKLDEDDLDLDLVEEIAQRTGRSLENFEQNPFYGKVTTVRNLVLFFNNQPVANAI